MICEEYLRTVDDSHQMTTAKAHIVELCQVVAGQKWRILELGSHAGISAAAIAIAAPCSTVVSVDLCDTVPQTYREAYWAAWGITNIQAIADDAGRFLRDSALHVEPWDLIFHDAVHGEIAVPEYLAAADITQRLAIHDWEQLSPASQATVAMRFASWTATADDKGRQLFVGWR